MDCPCGCGHPYDNSKARSDFYRLGLRCSFRGDCTGHLWTLWFRREVDREAFRDTLRPFVTGGAFEDLNT